jgi:hypothetical protein
MYHLLSLSKFVPGFLPRAPGGTDSTCDAWDPQERKLIIFRAQYEKSPTSSGFQGGLTASKRLDPLVVFLGASYFSSASRDIAGAQSNPSDVAGLRVGGSLAISPSTSVTTGFNVAYLTTRILQISSCRTRIKY